MNDMQTIRMLVVDDNPENIGFIEQKLEMSQIEIIHSRSGPHALELMVETDFALVLLNEEMLDINGYETAEFMRSNEKTSHIPIILITEKNQDQYHIFKGYQIGAVDYISKPIEPDILKNKVNIFLDMYRHKRALEKKNAALKKANKTIIEQQKSVIEEERLKLLLQISGAAAHELTQPLTTLFENVEHLTAFANENKMLGQVVSNIEKSTRTISDVIHKIQKIPIDTPIPPDTPARERDETQQTQILCVEDQDDDFIQISRLLDKHEHIVLTRTRTVEEALILAEHEMYDIIFMDYLLPDGTFFGFISKLKQSENEIPVAVITGLGDEVIAAQIIQAGAYDYLPRSRLNESSLMRMIENMREKANLRKEIKKANERMAQMAVIDKLTGLFNRRYFNDALDAEFERARRYGHEMLLLLIDLDFFKRVNDTYGHANGDMVLKKVAQRFKQVKRKNDVVCRYGGEEFAIILPNIDPANGYEVAQKFRQAIEKEKFFYGSSSFSITISVGAASSADGDSVEKLLACADKALYRAKETGRNKVVFFEI